MSSSFRTCCLLVLKLTALLLITSSSNMASGDSSSAAMTTVLNNGQKLPLVGLGTWKSEPGQVKAAVKEAIRLGYRHIDCAFFYMNEKEVGEALAECFAENLCSRSDLFITSKLWNNMHGDVVEAIKVTLGNLQLGYLDMWLIHWPVAHRKDVLWCKSADQYLSPEDQPVTETWKGMEACVEAGLTKGIGVSNFSIQKLEKILGSCTVVPAINQVERHPYLPQTQLVEFCNSKQIHVTGYSPLGSFDRESSMKKKEEPVMLQDPVVASIASKHNISPAQVLLRWAIQGKSSCSTIPKSVTPERMAQNLAVSQSDFANLDDGDLARLAAELPKFRYVDGKFFELPGGPYTANDLWGED